MTKSSQPSVKRALEELLENFAKKKPSVLKATITVFPYFAGYIGESKPSSLSQYTGMVRICPPDSGHYQCTIYTPFDDGATYHVQFTPGPFYRDEYRTVQKESILLRSNIAGFSPAPGHVCVEIKPITSARFAKK